MTYRTKTTMPSQRHAVSLLSAAFLGLSGTLPAVALGADDEAKIQEIAVFGKGETRQVQSLNASQLAQFPAGTSPLKAIEKLPGVNFQSADPYGAYEWSTRIVVRGFNQNQLGFTLDGVPLGDMSYANHNGLHISRAVMSENMGRVSLSQGAGALGTASTSNLGGTLAFTTADPSDSFGVMLNGTAGSDDARRGFARIDSGTLPTGTRLYVSYGNQDTEKWKGFGDQEQEYVNVKVVQPLGAATLSGYYSNSDRVEIDYQDMSLEMIDRLGRNWDNFGPDYARAIASAQGIFSGKQTQITDAYLNASGLRKDDLGYLTLELPLQDKLQWKTTVYRHTNDGQGLWATPFVPTPDGAPLSIRTTEYNIDRNGVVSALTFDLGRHSIDTGIWYEDNAFNQARRFYGEPSLEQATRSFKEFQRDPFFTQWEYAFNTDTVQIHLQDNWQVLENLKLQFGFKSVIVDAKANTIAGPNKTGKIETNEEFLPQIGFVYNLGDQHELFGSAARNVRALIGSATGTSPFSATQEGFEAIRDTIKPEKSTSLELGWRFHTDALEGVVSAYYVDFKNRLLAIQQGSAIIGNFNALANVGNVESIGLETGLNWQLSDWLTWYNSASFNRSTYGDDFVSGTELVATKGKTVVDSPKWLFNSELAIESGAAFAKLHYKYTDERYYTFLNQGSVSGFSMVNLSLGYHLANMGFMKELTAQFDVTNLLDKKYISTVGNGGFINSDPDGTAQTVLPGAARALFFSLKSLF
ncbi:MAG: TonB-dependent receptor [Pseudomonadales bacterium]|nr:TonB-dependent receptor [Pseudomonadales bacterium]